MSKLRYSITDDGVMVTLTRGVGEPVSAHLAAADLRRFAWAVLSDLDPEEAFEAGFKSPTPFQLGLLDRTPDTAPRKMPPRPQLLGGRILSTMRDGQTSTEIAAAVVSNRGRVLQEMRKLVAQGLVSCDERDGTLLWSRVVRAAA